MKAVNFKRVFAIAKKEFLHIIHDSRSLIIILIMPILQLTMFGYALNNEIQEIKLGVIDNNKSSVSQKIISHFQSNSFYKIKFIEYSDKEIDHQFLRQNLKAVIIIPKDFQTNLLNQKQPSIQLIIDGSDPNSATFINEYIQKTILMALNMIIKTPTNNSLSGIDIKTHMLYNPELKSSYFFVPGLIALILVMISAMLTSITITKEKEMGTLEQLLVSPLKPIDFILGKLSPYILLSFLIGTSIIGLGVLLFKVAFIGSIFLLICMSLVYITTALSLGLMISTITRNQIQAMMMAIIVTMLPTVMLSGFISPISAMPKFLQIISCLIPAKYYLKIVRGIMIKGNVFIDLLEPMLILILFTVIMVFISWKRFDKQVKELR